MSSYDKKKELRSRKNPGSDAQKSSPPQGQSPQQPPQTQQPQSRPPQPPRPVQQVKKKGGGRVPVAPVVVVLLLIGSVWWAIWGQVWVPDQWNKFRYNCPPEYPSASQVIDLGRGGISHISAWVDGAGVLQVEEVLYPKEGGSPILMRPAQASGRFEGGCLQPKITIAPLISNKPNHLLDVQVEVGEQKAVYANMGKGQVLHLLASDDKLRYDPGYLDRPTPGPTPKHPTTPTPTQKK